jgi:FMN reductase
MAITANSSQPLFDPDGMLTDQGIASQLDIMTEQVVTFARMKRAYADAGRAVLTA